MSLVLKLAALPLAPKLTIRNWPAPEPLPGIVPGLPLVRTQLDALLQSKLTAPVHTVFDCACKTLGASSNKQVRTEPETNGEQIREFRFIAFAGLHCTTSRVTLFTPILSQSHVFFRRRSMRD